MGEKAEYRSAVRSRKLIRQALIELMQEKDYAKITVTDIINRADINRGTFYAHYQDIRAVFEQIENEIVEKLRELLSEFNYNNFFQDPLPLLLKISSWLKTDIEFYRILINSRGSEEFLVKLRNIFVKEMQIDSDIPDNIKNTPQFFIHAHFFAGGIINSYQVWFRNEADIPLEDISVEISKILTNVYPTLSGKSALIYNS